MSERPFGQSHYQRGEAGGDAAQVKSQKETVKKDAGVEGGLVRRGSRTEGVPALKRPDHEVVGPSDKGPAEPETLAGDAGERVAIVRDRGDAGERFPPCGVTTG